MSATKRTLIRTTRPNIPQRISWRYKLCGHKYEQSYTYRVLFHNQLKVKIHRGLPNEENKSTNTRLKIHILNCYNSAVGNYPGENEITSEWESNLRIGSFAPPWNFNLTRIPIIVAKQCIIQYCYESRPWNDYRGWHLKTNWGFIVGVEKQLIPPISAWLE